MSQPPRKKAADSVGSGKGGAQAPPGASVDGDRRLEQLYEVTKLLASYESLGESLDEVLFVITRALPLRTAILIEQNAGRSKMTVWPSEAENSEEIAALKQRAEAAYAYFVGAAAAGSDRWEEKAGSMLPRQPPRGASSERRFIVLPLVVSRRPPFGALQLECVHPPIKADLTFISAIANQLAIALDRDRAWRGDIIRREDAEVARAEAETSSKQNYALAQENARLFQQAREAVRGREQILAVVSHDLKNPLSTIMMAARLLAKRRGDEDWTRKGLPQVEKIRRAAEQMVRMIGDLLDFASIEAGRLSIKRGPHDPGAILRETMASFDAVAQGKRLRWKLEIPPGLPPADCDRDRILQVLSNLVGNAIKVVARGGHISLQVEADPPELKFSVVDDGPGIGADDLLHLFDRYWRSDQVEYKGTGLGLAIARGIVRAHGGRIWAESELGKGSTFRFTVPAA
jgi:signal transduction histidine kinase